MVQAKRLMVAIATAFFLSSCVPQQEELSWGEHCPQISTRSQTKSEDLTISLHVDGSGSMLGYVKNESTNYIKALEELDAMFDNVIYYRNGNSPQQITRQDYRKAHLSVFYDGSDPQKFPEVSSPIDAAISPSENGNTLNVIVTDLEQDDGDVINLNKKIKQHYLNSEKKYSVGIWAVKSEFNGKVYFSSQGKLTSFPYNTEGKEAKEFRPFYVIFLGKYEDIAYYFDKLKANAAPTLISNSQLTIFSPERIVNEISHFQTLNPEGSSPTSLNDGKVAIEATLPPYQLLEIDNNQTESIPIQYSIPLSPSSYTLPIDANLLKTRVEIKTFDEFEKTFQPVPDNSQLEKAIEVSNFEILQNENKLNFTTTIQPNEFTEPGVYLFSIDVLSQDLQKPIWWEEWDWENRENNQDGARTHNLNDFLEKLKDNTLEIVQKDNSTAIIGRFCYAIQKN